MVVAVVDPVLAFVLKTLLFLRATVATGTLTHHHRQMCTLLPLGAMSMDIHHHLRRRRGHTPHHLSTLHHRGTRATSTTSSALTTRRRHRMESTSSSTTTTTMETRVEVDLPPLGSSKDVWLLSAAAACWKNAASASEMLDTR